MKNKYKNFIIFIVNNDLTHIIESFDFDKLQSNDLGGSFANDYYKKELEILKKTNPKALQKIEKFRKDAQLFTQCFPQYIPILQMTIDDILESRKIIVKDRKELQKVIEKIISVNPKANLNFIDVSYVTDMSYLFTNSNFNGDISEWNVSNVTNMSAMFDNSKFNGDISKWNVGNVTKMCWMFSDSVFNGDISKWNVSNVTDMSNMFESSKFNGDISNWDVSNVHDMSFMFYCAKFNQPIGKWNIQNLREASNMFDGSKFNQNISNWPIPKLKKTEEIFNDAFYDCPIKPEFKPKFIQKI